MFRLIFILCLLKALFVSGSVIHEIQVTDTEEHELFSDRYQSTDYIIKTPNSNHLEIHIEYVDTMPQFGDYLLIKRGPSFDDPGSGYVLTGRNIKNVKPIVISSMSTLIRFFALKEPRGALAPKGFRLKYKAVGHKVTTTETPITSSPLPTPANEDKTVFKVYISGFKDYEYKQKPLLDKLKLALSEMATLYCTNEALPLVEPITINNVKLIELERCSMTMPDYEDCVTVEFQLPVVLDASHEGYELLTKHLEIMWIRYSSKILEKYNFRSYAVRDLDTELEHWDIIFGVLIGLFIVVIGVIFIIRQCCPKCHKMAEDDEQILSQKEFRDTNVSNEVEFTKFDIRSQRQSNREETNLGNGRASFPSISEDD